MKIEEMYFKRENKEFTFPAVKMTDGKIQNKGGKIKA